MDQLPALPEAYIHQMTRLLGDEAEAFFRSYNSPRVHGLRINPAKLEENSPAFIRMREAFQLEPVPWCATGYYYAEEARPGKHPYHAAGLYYIQEPSAMSSAELLDPQPGETVLDLAAAPGGKTTQLAAKLGSDGLLLANEIHPARAKILSENTERMGLANTVVLNEPPDRLAAKFPAAFDKIMLDAPCSGEGMFRKDPEAIQEWSPDQVKKCAARQIDILDQAIIMLKPGGLLAYSTCTFNREENEQVIEQALARYPDLSLVRTERIWPHRARGEGHFVAILQKAGEAEQKPSLLKDKRKRKANRAADEAWKQFEAFAGQILTGLPILPPGEALLFGEQLYWLPSGRQGWLRPELLDGLRVLRPGLHLATVRKNRLEPAHALALALPADAFRQKADFSPDAPELAAYLRGEVIPAPADSATWNNWLTVAVDGYPIGWGKQTMGTIKNHYPKGLRQP